MKLEESARIPLRMHAVGGCGIPTAFFTAGSPNGRLVALGTGAGKLGIGRLLLGPGASLKLALVLEVAGVLALALEVEKC